jgi:transposase
VDRNHSGEYERKEQRYASDVTDGERALIEPQLPGKRPLGRPREVELRVVFNALLYIARTGCQWRQLPQEFPPFTTVQHNFYAWRDSGVLKKSNFALLLQARETAGREPSPSAGNHRQPIGQDHRARRSLSSGRPKADPGDAGKKIKGRKRQIITDTLGLLVGAEIHPGDPLDDRGRQAQRQCRGFCSASPSPGRRTHIGVAQSKPPLGERLRRLPRQRQGWLYLGSIQLLIRRRARA